MTLRILIIVVLLMLPAKESRAACYAPIAGNGPEVKALEIDGPSNHWAHAFFNPFNGQPTIVYGPTFYTLPSLLKRFTRKHECCHLTIPTTDEIEANCCALEELNLSEKEIDKIGKFLSKYKWLPPQYGGSGSEYWEETLRQCR